MFRPESGSPDERRLVRGFRKLGAADRETLLAFADFLVTRGAPPAAAVVSMPVPEPRPERESVVAAIKRLRRVYPMLEGGALLTETSSLMAAHVLQGRAVVEVIDELEVLFASRYAEGLGSSTGDTGVEVAGPASSD